MRIIKRKERLKIQCNTFYYARSDHRSVSVLHSISLRKMEVLAAAID